MIPCFPGSVILLLYPATLWLADDASPNSLAIGKHRRIQYTGIMIPLCDIGDGGMVRVRASLVELFVCRDQGSLLTRMKKLPLLVRMDRRGLNGTVSQKLVSS